MRDALQHAEELSVLAQQTAAVVLSLLYFLVDVMPTYAYV